MSNNQSAADISSSGFRRYFVNTSWLVAEKIFSSLIIFAVGVYVARYLGPDRLGLLSYSQSFVLLFVPLANLGLDSIIVRELVKDETKRDVLLGTGFALKLAGVLLAWAVLASVVPLADNDGYTNLLIAIIASSLLFQSFGTVDFYFQAKVMSKYMVMARLVAGILIPIIKVGLILFQAQLIWFALVILLQDLIVGVLFLVAYRLQKLSVFHWRFNSAIARQLLMVSWPLMFAGLMIVVYMKIDQIMLKNMLDTTQVGIYAVAVRLSEFWYFMPLLISQSIFPAIINAKTGDGVVYRQRMQQLYDLMTFLSLGIAIIVTLSSSLIMDTLYGPPYSGSDTVLAIHIWAGVIVFFGTARGKWIITENLQKKALFIYITGVILNVILNIVLIPIYGVVGAALATLISYTFCNIIISILIKEFREPLIMFIKSFVHCITFKTVRQLVHGKYVI